MSVRISCAHRHLAHCCYSYSPPHLPCKAKLLLLLIRCFSMQFAVCGHECAPNGLHNDWQGDERTAQKI